MLSSAWPAPIHLWLLLFLLLVLASEPVQRVLSDWEPLLCAVPGDESHHWHLATPVAFIV